MIWNYPASFIKVLIKWYFTNLKQKRKKYSHTWATIQCFSPYATSQWARWRSWNIPGMFHPTFENDPLIVQNDKCMNVQVRIFIQCSELNAKWIIWIQNVAWTLEVICAMEALGNRSIFYDIWNISIQRLYNVNSEHSGKVRT